ncbi:MAG TPA: CAP domain-containing protein, partial [Thermoanaerobaculia bacterium]
GLRDLDRVRSEMLAQVNAQRRKAGASPLKLDQDLQEAAQAHAQDMLARGYFAHKSPSDTPVRERARSAGYDWRTIGENIAEGQLSAGEVMRTWMNSPGHRRNILDPNFRELGVGLALGRSGSGYRVLWAQAFGTARKK